MNASIESASKDGVSPVDLTGRDRMGRNVLSGWASYGVFIVAGFVTPRFIDRNMGQQALGVWDFAWSLVAYFGLVQAGVVSSVNRYVALYRISSDFDGINRAVSSVTCLLVAMAAVVAALGAAAALLMPLLLTSQLGEFLRDAQWLVFVLSIGLATQIGLAGYSGVLTGCHRWDLHQGIEAGIEGLTVVGIVVLLLLGYGLPSLGIAYTVGQALGRGTRVRLAHRILPSLRVRFSLATRAQARAMFAFGGKSFLGIIADLLLTQGIHLVILAYLGPSVLAVYARPRSLIRHVNSLVTKFSNVLAPSSSSLCGLGGMDELRDLYIKGTRLAACITFPSVVVLAILGGPILEVWMGEAYADGTLLAILALGFLLPIVQESAVTILMGMNSHGVVFLAKLVAAIVTCVGTIVLLSCTDPSLAMIGLATTLPLTVLYALFVAFHACRRLDVTMAAYIKGSFGAPCAAAALLAAVLLVCRWESDGHAIRSLALGIPLGMVAVAAVYWLFAVPREWRLRVRSFLARCMPLN